MSDLNPYDASTEEHNKTLWSAAVGKTIGSIVLESSFAEDLLTVVFTDGSLLVIRSWDYEGYSSGLAISDG